ncbi:MAG: prepilin-type N-terminal cleavage/methylation domain-containing protein [Epsilonproteobacteria bacterium]|nr:prepilin-type N-terminal cleavage/methylation domain-containing protein [Campylobacterota bacterium]
MNFKNKRVAFTLLEVLISIMLLSLVLMALYKSAEILRNSNKNLFHHLEKSSGAIKGAKTIYEDILQSDGNITIDTKKKFHHIIIENTRHSLYQMPSAKVVWLVYKENNSLLRVEGGKYNMPLKNEQNVAIDEVATNMELFKAYKSKKEKKMLVVMKIRGEETQSFMVQNISTIKKNKDNTPINLNDIGKDKNKK